MLLLAVDLLSVSSSAVGQNTGLGEGITTMCAMWWQRERGRSGVPMLCVGVVVSSIYNNPRAQKKPPESPRGPGGAYTVLCPTPLVFWTLPTAPRASEASSSHLRGTARVFHTRFSQKKKGNSSLLRYTTHVAQVFYGACTPDGVDGLLLAVGFPSMVKVLTGRAT